MPDEHPTDDEFFDLLAGIDDAIPGPSDEFATVLLDELRTSSPVRVADAGLFSIESAEPAHDLDAPLFEQPEAHGQSSSRWWLVAAAVTAIALIGASFFFLTDSGGPAVIATGDTTSQDLPDDTAADGTLGSVAETDDETDDETGNDTSRSALAFTAPLGFTQVSTNDLEAVFTTSQDTVFNATLRSGDQIIDTQSASSIADATTSVQFGGLDATTLYSLEVTLIGPPVLVSPRLEIRTAGDDTPVEITSLGLAAVTASTALVTFETNLCASTSVVVLDARDQREVQRVMSERDDVCAHDHELAIGTGTPLDPATDYVVLVEATASMGENSNSSNVTSESISLRTDQ